MKSFDIRRITCFKQEGWWFDDHIKAIFFNVEGGQPEFFKGWINMSAKIADFGKFHDGLSVCYDAGVHRYNIADGGKSTQMILLDDDSLDEDDLLGVSSFGTYAFYEPDYVIQHRRFTNHGVDYEVEIHTFERTYSGTEKTYKMYEMRNQKVKDLIPGTTAMAMQHSYFDGLDSISLEEVRKTLEGQVSYRLNVAGFSAIQVSPDDTEEALDAYLTKKLQTAAEKFSGNYFETYSYIKGKVHEAIIQAQVKNKLSLHDPKGFGSRLHQLITPSDQNRVMNALPLSDSGAQKLGRVVKGRVQLELTIASNKLKAELKKLHEAEAAPTLKDFEQMVKSKIAELVKELQPVIESKLMTAAKELMFLYPEEYLTPAIIVKMVAKMKRVQDGSISEISDSSVDDAFLNTTGGYGLRPRLANRVRVSNKIKSVYDFAAARKPVNKGSIEGLGADIFFDVVMGSR